MILATALWSQSALRFVLLGAATGSLSALVALGIVLVYRTSGVLNFSAGALGGIAAYICYDIRDGGMPTASRVALGLLVGVGLGLLTYVVMALLRDSVARLTRLIATLGLFSVFESFMVLRWGIDFSQPRSLLPSQNMTLFGSLVIGRDRLMLIGFALVCALVLRIVYSGTLFGLATLRGRREPPGRGERGMVARPDRDGKLRGSRAGCRHSPPFCSPRSSR